MARKTVPATKTISKNRLVLELHVPDFHKVKEFYGKLGFDVVYEEPVGEQLGYIVLKAGNTYLNFYGGNDRVYKHRFFKVFPKGTRRGYGVEITIPVDDVEKYYKKLSQKVGGNIVEPLALRRWDRKDFRLVDPFGYYIRITEPVEWLK